MTYQFLSPAAVKKALMLNHAVGGFHSRSSVSCHTPGARSHSPVAIVSNASVRTDRSPSARALAYRAGHSA
ncbi:hypothetical protein AB0I16_34560 [Streptomyces sp. NPDC050703]|uniref:hypothetical protein n=1 Tax=Streptomyces sp. NPDC050703 TaxID=3157218 RepID=UPI00342CEBE8